MKMLAEEKELRKIVSTYAKGDIYNANGDEVPLKLTVLRLITALVKAVREDAAKECDGVAEFYFYRALRDKGPKEYSKDIDMDTLRMFAAEGCAAAIRRK
jgi:hypothetical protein